jgi:hypothetical protein
MRLSSVRREHRWNTAGGFLAAVEDAHNARCRVRRRAEARTAPTSSHRVMNDERIGSLEPPEPALKRSSNDPLWATSLSPSE